MTTTYTASGRLAIAQTGDPAIKDQWGTPLTSLNFSLIDSMINGTASIDVTGLSSIVLSVANGQPDQSRELAQQFIGALSGACTATLPNVPKYGWVKNSTTGGFNVVLSVGAGTTAQIPPDGRLYYYVSDGNTNIAIAPLAYAFQGTTNGSNALPGQVGEYLSNSVGSVVYAPAGNGIMTVVTLPLTAGDWEVSGNFSAGILAAGFSGLSAWIGSPGVVFTSLNGSVVNISPSVGLGVVGFPLGSVRFSSAASQVAAVNLAIQPGNGNLIQGFIQARRVH